jgi:parvulin-like peptidyl-prolyl isomerase
VLAAHILVQKEEDAKRILTEIKGGADFATLAKKYSIDPGSKDNGGKMPWTDKDKFVPEFAEACWKLNPGQISELVKTDYGYHIIKLIDKRPGGQMTFAEAKSEAKEQLLSKMKQDNYSKLIEKLKKKADIKKYLPEEKTTQTPGGVLPGGAPSSQPPAQPGTETGK